MKELMWACAILPDRENAYIRDTCRRCNQKIGLPETVFRFPLHISLKKSWECDRFEAARKDTAAFLKSRGCFEISFGPPVMRKNMIWLPVNVTEDLSMIHKRLDELFEQKYGVPPAAFDLNFKPHVSLFTKGDPEEITAMHAMLAKELQPMTMRIRKAVIGGSIHRDTFYMI